MMDREASEVCAATDIAPLTIPEQVAQTLSDAQTRSPNTLPSLLPVVYDELRRLGRSLLRTERIGHTLQPTAIVHEAYQRLVGINPEIHDRAHCYRLLAQAMRRVLIDHAKARCREKRELPTAEEMKSLTATPFAAGGSTPADILDIDAALQGLAKHSEEVAEMVQLHYFLGVEAQELAALFSTSEASVTRSLRFAKAWLAKFVQSVEPPHGGEEASTTA
jgi:RNA polymerase sigma factor (TIGR02999 family)